MSNPESLSLDTSKIEVLTLMNVMVIAMEKRAKLHRAQHTPLDQVALIPDAFADTALKAPIFSDEELEALKIIEDKLKSEYLLDDQESDEE